MSKRHRARGRRRIKAGKRHRYVMWSDGALCKLFRMVGRGRVNVTVNWGGLPPLPPLDQPAIGKTRAMVRMAGENVGWLTGFDIEPMASFRMDHGLHFRPSPPILPPVMLPVACLEDKDFDFAQGIDGSVIPVLRPR